MPFERACWLLAALPLLIGCGAPADPSSGGSVGWSFRATSEGFEVRQGAGDFRPFLPIGINFGLAVPGTYPGEFAASPSQIASWLEQTASLGANVVRTYTVQSPDFYRELRRWNVEHPERPLFLLQGAWLIEPEGALPDYLAEEVGLWFRSEIERAVDAVYGNLALPEAGPDHPENYGRATGSFDADVSPWLLGWLIGREVEPHTLATTYDRHPDARRYDGALFRVEDGDPFEPFIARNFDYLAAWEQERYGGAHPLGFSNWPTLDPLRHPIEPPFPISSEDRFALDMRRIAVSADFEPGIFVSYHAYPYYPDFIVYGPTYQVEDDDGPNSYLGYLRDLRAAYEGYTLLVGEIGIPSSQGSARRIPSGLDHGGLDEVEQGQALVRTVRSILDAGFDGLALFSIVDEWWKRTWLLDPVELPGDRRHLWFNPLSPEQNFGLIALRPGPAEGRHMVDGDDEEWRASPLLTKDAGPLAPLEDGHDGARTLRDVTLEHDEGYLHLRVRLGHAGPIDWEAIDYWIAFDTHDAARGERFLDEGRTIEVGSRAEFLLRIESPDAVSLSVVPSYDLYGVWHGERTEAQLYRSIPSEAGVFVPMRNLISWELFHEGVQIAPFVDDPIGQLPTGHEASKSDSNFWFSEEKGVLELRIPWGLLQIADPSGLQVIDGEEWPGRLATSTTEGIAIAVISLGPGGELVDSLPAAEREADRWIIPTKRSPRYAWEGWDEVRYHERPKASFGILRDALPELEKRWRRSEARSF